MKEFLKQAGCKSLILLICVMCLSRGSVSRQMNTETVLFADDFNDSSLDMTKWIANDVFSGYTDTTLPVSEINQHLEIGPLPLHTTGSDYNGIRSASRYNFTNAYCYAEILQPADPLTSGAAMMTIGYDRSNYYRIYVEAGSLICQKKIGGVRTNLLTATYDSSNHKFVRICHDSATGDVIFETAAVNEEAPAAWAQRYREEWNTASMPLEQVQFELKAGTSHTESHAPGTVIFDNFKAAIADIEPPDPRVELSSLTLNPSSVVGGSPSQGTVALSGAAPSGGAVVTLSSSNTNVATVPASVTISPGASSASFTVVTSSVLASTSVYVSGNYNNVTKTATLIVTAPPPPPVELSSLTLNPSSVVGGSPSLGTVTLTVAAPSSGAVVSLSSSEVSVATVPSTVTVPAGSLNAIFTVITSAISTTASVNISADYAATTKTAQLSVNPPSPPQPPATSMLYVDPAGSDLNPGTLEQPFRTIQRAADLVNPGDTVIVEDGSYTDSDGDAAIVTLNRGGTSTDWITFKSENKWGAKLDGQNNTSDTGWRFGAGGNYIRIEGFEVFGVGKASGSGSGFELYSGGHDVQIVANHIHDIGRLCTDTTNGEVGIFIQQDRVVVEQNLIHDIGRFAPGENGCSPVTAYYKNHDHGVYIDNANDVTVRNNIFYNTKRGWAIQIYPGPSDRIAILNNTFAFENPYNYGHIIMAASGTDNRIENNIFYDPNTAAIYFYSGTQTNMVVINNITYSGSIKYGSAAGVIFGNNLDNTDPLLVSPATLDFHLQSGSRAIDAGLTLLEVPNDYEGRGRPQGITYDIGAYEFSSGSSLMARKATEAQSYVPLKGLPRAETIYLRGGYLPWAVIRILSISPAAPIMLDFNSD